MTWFAWQEGFRLGIADIDDDHRRLFALIRHITGQDPCDEPLENLLIALRDAVEAHFEREAALLDRIGHPEAGQSALHYAEQSDNLATVLGSVARQGRVSGEVAEFLHTWLLNHVVCHDLRLRESLRRAGVAAQDDRRRTPWLRFTRGLDRIGLRWRIALLAALPLLAVAAAGALEVARIGEAARSMRDLADTTMLGTRVGGLVHELQRERGASALLLAGPDGGAPAGLAGQRRLTDAARDALVAGGGTGRGLPPQLARLPEMRARIDARTLPEREAVAYFSGLITELLHLVQAGVAARTAGTLAEDTTAYVMLMRAKEHAGQERAAGAAGLRAGMDEAEYLRFHRLAAEQRVFEENFLLIAGPELTRAYGSILSGPDRRVAELRQRLLAGVGAAAPSGVSVEEWFQATTVRIDAMKRVEDELARHIIAQASSMHLAAWEQVAWLAAVAVVLLMAVAGPMLLLAGSVVPPLTALHRAVRRLAAGDRTAAIPGTELRDEIGALARAVAGFRDGLISRDMMSLQARLEVSSLVRSIADHLPGVVFQQTHAPDGAMFCTYVSEKARHYADASPDALVGRVDAEGLAARIHPDDRDRVAEEVGRSLAAGRPVHAEFRIRAADDATYWLRVAMMPRRTADGVQVWDGIALDVTELKESESQRSAAAQRLRQLYKLQALSQLAGGMAHEINNLLQPIIGLSELAISSLPEDSKPRFYMRNVLAAGQQARALVAKITSFSRIDPLDREPVNLADAVQRAVDLLDGILPRSVRLRAEIADADVTILGNAGELQQVLMNLCTNSVHAIGDGGGGIVLSVARERRDGQDAAVLSVADSGCGIDEAIQERIFDPFFTTKEVGKGSGLGLALVNSIVSSFGGHVEVHSRPGEGATFVLTFPAHQPAAAAGEACR